MQGAFAGVVGWQKNSFIDFPGTVSTVLFFSACNLQCPYCHNPGIVNASSQNQIDENAIWEFLQQRWNIIDGVVFSGGEPTLHANLLQAAEKVRVLGYKVKLDTNGLLPNVIKRIKPDFLGLDIKTLPKLYKELCGSPYEDTETRLQQSLDIAREMKENAEVRITCAPGFVSREIIKDLGMLLQGISTVFLQPMQNKVELLNPEFAKKELISKEEILGFQELLTPCVGKCNIRGS
jgi:pyruvate formate lyase activating enzyme